MTLWILGQIIDEGSDKESSNWDFFGIFCCRDDALRAFGSIRCNKPERFFIAPVNTGNILMEDITEMPGFEFILKAPDKMI